MPRQPSLPMLLDQVRLTLWFGKGGAVAARLIQAHLQRLTVALEEDLDQPLPTGVAVIVHVESRTLESPVKALTRLSSSSDFARGGCVHLEVLDWLGLREQLPASLRRLFSVREGERYVPPKEAPIEVNVRFPQAALRGICPLRDLSVHGLSLHVPSAWAHSIHEGMNAHLGLTLPGQEVPIAVLGFVRHLRIEKDHAWAGLVFDGLLTPDLATQQLRILKFLHPADAQD